MAEQRLKDRIALITGASRGIGRAVALAYAREGAHVVLVARTVGALEELDDEIRALGGKATLVPLNLTDKEKVDGLGPSLYPRWEKLDIFVGNAGLLGPLSPLGHIRDRDWEAVMAVNVTANWRLIRSLDPLLRRSDAGRVIFVTSGASDGHHAYWGPYAVSKAALDSLGKTYAAEVANSDIRVNMIDPGRVRTEMRAQAYPGEDPETLPAPEDITETFIELAQPSCTDNGRIVKAARK